ncbi:hypothetical protein MOK15_00640 [Sphingobium sp. BYY-5]|uniref:hypothetical protein n=1 Tax=Sphingobium sp. BYY-5 TaxID=2926400 RepID=UPI001FA6EA70|nr:hypothetical protein [Sphingobium sp. BYY-5]MCI4588616.1 hypothetical protein [Sphingobium sp. BYY-5]
MTTMLRRIASWWQSLDAVLKINALVCAVPIFIMLFTRGPETVGPTGFEYSILEILVQWFIGVPALFLFAPVVGASQFGLFWLARRSPDAWMRWLFCTAAIALLYPYREFLRTTNLTGSSTSALGAIFYPLYLAIGALPIAAGIWWVRIRFRRDGKL